MNIIEVTCTGCGRTTAQHPAYSRPPRCMDCARRDFGLDDSRWFTPIGSWHPTIARVLPGERPRAVAELGAGRPAPAAPYAILRPAQLYDLATPGTPAGILAVARAAQQGGGWRTVATFALAADPAGVVVASLALRLCGDLPGRPRRAWVVYARQAAGGWESRGASLLDHGAERTVRPVGIEELKATLRGDTWVPPAPRPPAPTVPCPSCGAPARLTGAGKIYANHRCATTTGTEGRS